MILVKIFKKKSKVFIKNQLGLVRKYNVTTFLSTNHILKNPDVVTSNTTSKMADTESIGTIDTSNDAGDDPLQDLTDEQLYQLVEDTQ